VEVAGVMWVRLFGMARRDPLGFWRVCTRNVDVSRYRELAPRKDMAIVVVAKYCSELTCSVEWRCVFRYDIEATISSRWAMGLSSGWSVCGSDCS
jgi:hypothetical protein